jgi:hypothetical protein
MISYHIYYTQSVCVPVTGNIRRQISYSRRCSRVGWRWSLPASYFCPCCPCKSSGRVGVHVLINFKVSKSFRLSTRKGQSVPAYKYVCYLLRTRLRYVICKCIYKFHRGITLPWLWKVNQSTVFVNCYENISHMRRGVGWGPPQIFWNTNVDYVANNQPLVSILSQINPAHTPTLFYFSKTQINPVHTLQFYLFKSHFNIIIP